MCAACNSYDSRKCGEGGGECGEGENKSCAWSGRLAFSELPGPWNWDLATPPLNPLVPLSSRHLSLPGAATSAARCPPFPRLAWPPRTGAFSPRAFTPQIL